jgi:hypothetical protein
MEILFPTQSKLLEYVRDHTDSSDTIAVLGSELRFTFTHTVIPQLGTFTLIR